MIMFFGGSDVTLVSESTKTYSAKIESQQLNSHIKLHIYIYLFRYEAVFQKPRESRGYLLFPYHAPLMIDFSDS